MIHFPDDVTLLSVGKAMMLAQLLDRADDSVAETDEGAVIEGEVLAENLLQSRGIGHRPLIVSAVCIQDVKVRRRP
jgi:hypothetical protein